MKTKLMLISILTAACIFVFSGATWAESKKDRRNKKPQKKHYVVAKSTKPVVHWQNQRPQASRSQDVKHRYHKRLSQRGKYHRYYNHKPDYRHFHKHGWYYKPHHKSHRPIKKYHRNRHHRPIFSHTDDNVSILASTSRRGWSIKISSRD